MRVLATVVAVLVLSSCAVQYGANRYAPDARMPTDLCVKESAGVREEFLQVLVPLLKARQVAVKVLPASAPNDACPFMMTYSATWHWDLVSYMREARIEIYRDGSLFANAHFLAPHGLINMSVEAFDKTEVKIDRMLVRLGFSTLPASP